MPDLAEIAESMMEQRNAAQDEVKALQERLSESEATCAALMQWQGKAFSVISDISVPIRKCFTDRTMPFAEFSERARQWEIEHVDRVGLQLENDPTFSKAGHELLERIRDLKAIVAEIREATKHRYMHKLNSATWIEHVAKVHHAPDCPGCRSDKQLADALERAKAKEAT